MTNTNRFIQFNRANDPSAISINAGHIGVWNTVLGAAEVTEIFDGKHQINLTMDTGNYTSSADLQHYWRPGFPDEGFSDEGAASPSSDLTDSPLINTGDIVQDAPA